MMVVVVSCGCFFWLFQIFLQGTVKANALAANFAKIDSLCFFFPKAYPAARRRGIFRGPGGLEILSQVCSMARVLRAPIAKQTSICRHSLRADC